MVGMDPQVRDNIHCMLDDGCFTGWGGGPVCSSLSSAVNPPCRTKAHPYGRPGLSKNMKKKVVDGNSFARWVARLIHMYHGRFWFWVENPQSSFLWRLPCYKAILCQGMGEFLQLDYCRFGTPWRKHTRFYTNIVTLHRKPCYCLGGHSHQLLKGMSPSGLPWTKVAEPYPYAVAEIMALGVAVHSGWVEAVIDLDAISLAAIASTA